MVERKTIFRWGAALLALLLLYSLPDGFSARFHGLFKDAAAPVQRVVIQAVQGLKEAVDTVRGLGGLLEENSRLSEELIYLQARLVELENLDQANRRLQEQLGFYRSQHSALIPARVISRSISGWWHSVRLDRGRDHGVEANCAVISPDGLVGRTSEVSWMTADVLLLSDPDCKVSARISRTGSFGLVSGNGVNAGGYPVARMRFIHKDAPVQPGDAVVTSGLGGVFPRDILIGYVETTGMEEGGLYQVAVIIPKAVTELMDVVFISAGDETGGPEQ